MDEAAIEVVLTEDCSGEAARGMRAVAPGLATIVAQENSQ
jgi:hypothetical protein